MRFEELLRAPEALRDCSPAALCIHSLKPSCWELLGLHLLQLKQTARESWQPKGNRILRNWGPGGLLLLPSGAPRYPSSGNTPLHFSLTLLVGFHS